MREEVYVIGHRNPDTDSIISAITYANLLNKIGYGNAIPARLGELNTETKFILKYFKVDPPIFLESVEPKIEDLKLILRIPKLTPEDPINKALKIMIDKDIGLLPIVNNNEEYIGDLTLSDILRDYMETLEKSFERHDLYYETIIEVLNGEIIHGKLKGKKTLIKGRVLLDSSLRVDEKCNKNDIVITGANELLQMNAFKSGAGFFIITKNCHLLPEMWDIISKNNSLVVKVSYDCFETIKLLNLIIPVKNLMSSKSRYIFHYTDYLKNVHKSIENLDPKFQHFPVVDHDNKLIGLITRDLDYYPKNVVLVDHNEISQSVKGIEQARVVQVIDHHKLSDIQSQVPIFVYCKPIGSTATIIWERYKQENIQITRKIAGLLLSAILSDTLLLTSPTCTEVDKLAAYMLAEIANIDINKFGPKMIEAITAIEDKTIEQIFNEDLKIFTFKDRRFCISQINTTNYKKFKLRDEVLPFLEKLCKKENYEFAILMLTDVVLDGSELIFEGERKDLVRKAFNVNEGENSIFLEGVVSRKKQVVPPLLATLSIYD
ncbi:MAG: putative manganese-dependent inorganic diphosphatase [Candidatus Helarchaeota archaeon]